MLVVTDDDHDDDDDRWTHVIKKEGRQKASCKT